MGSTNCLRAEVMMGHYSRPIKASRGNPTTHADPCDMTSALAALPLSDWGRQPLRSVGRDKGEPDATLLRHPTEQENIVQSLPTHKTAMAARQQG
jgi:hypothetical protein